jgi:hypothetical protein
MPDNQDTGLSPNQQAMLDLALACDLETSKPETCDAIRQRHRAIKSQKDAAEYMREVENKIHSRRKFPVSTTQP